MQGFLLIANAWWHPLAWLFLSMAGVLGMLALVSPGRFSWLAQAGGRWVDTDRVLAYLDKRYDLDNYILPFSRVLGALVVASVAVLALLLARL